MNNPNLNYKVMNPLILDESTIKVINENNLPTLSAIIVRQSYNTRERE
jgi:hypothetical protein